MYQERDINPLPECPETPNCSRVSVRFDVPTHDLYRVAEQALKGMDPEETREVSPLHVASVHRVWFFLDDMDFAVTEREGGAVLHVRSASRAGRSDLGVNGRRVRRFVRAVRHLLSRQGVSEPQDR